MISPRSTALRCLILAALAALILQGEAVSASQRPLSLEEMVELSDDIVVGRVVDTDSRWQGKLIVTVAAVEVEETIKGGNGTRIEITQLGGTAVHPETGIAVSMNASNQVALRPGEEVLLFISRTPTGVRQLVGGPQGKFVIREDPDTRIRKLPVGPKRLEVLRGVDGDTITSESMTLDAMSGRIRSYVKRTPDTSGGTEP